MKKSKVSKVLDEGATDANLPVWLSKAVAEEHAARDLKAFLMAQPEIQKVRDLIPLKVSKYTWVFSLYVNDEKVVIKRFFKATADETVRKLKSELDYLEVLFSGGDCQANKCLMAWPDHGIVMLSFAPGQRLGDIIAGVTGDERRKLLNHSGRWLAGYTAPRRHEGSFSPNFWVKRILKKNLSGITDPADLTLLRRLVHSMEAQGKKIRGCPVVHAATHSDFVGINAHYSEGVIYGVDIQGETWRPMAKDAARFLVWLQIHDDGRPSARRAGISQDDWDGFLSSGVISEREQETTMPFLVGEQLYGRYVSDYARPRIRENTRTAITAYLEEYLPQS